MAQHQQGLPCSFPESCQYCTFLAKQNVEMLQCLSSAGDSPRRFLSSVAECKILSEAFDTVVNLGCSIRFVKPAEGGKARVKAALPLGRGCLLDWTSASYGRLWICFNVCFPLKKKKAYFSNQSHVIPKQIPPASAHAALFQTLQVIFLHDLFIICTDPIMESEIISIKIVDDR